MKRRECQGGVGGNSRDFHYHKFPGTSVIPAHRLNERHGQARFNGGLSPADREKMVFEDAVEPRREKWNDDERGGKGANCLEIGVSSTS